MDLVTYDKDDGGDMDEQEELRLKEQAEKEESLNDPNRVYEMSKVGNYRKGWIVDKWNDEKGHVIVKYESGMIRDLDTHSIIKATDNPYFADNWREMQMQRKERAAAAMRDEISRQTFGLDDPHKSIEAVGYMAGMLWKDIAMNPDAYPRDRLNTFLQIGMKAGLLSDERYNEATQPGVNVSIGQNLAREIIEKLMNKNES